MKLTKNGNTGPPLRRDGIRVDGNTLAILSMNDGAMTFSRIESMIPDDFERFDETSLPKDILPKKTAFIFTQSTTPQPPNHISFLSEGVNDSMINFLSPLLPIAQALKIPVLDFDKYKESRDSKPTADVVIPLISAFLQQYMLEDNKALKS